MEVWGPFDWLAFILVAIPAAQMAIDSWLSRSEKAGELRRSWLWSRAPAFCICGAAIIALVDHLGFIERSKVHSTRVEIGAGAELKGPFTIYDEAGRILYSLPENGVTTVPKSFP